MFVPDNIVSNDDLAEFMETSDEWIVERSGIRQRRWVTEETSASDLAEKASRLAIEKAGLEISQIDCIILATLSPDHTFPGTACFLQRKLGLNGIPAVDVRNQCSGFIYALSIADAWIKTNQYKNILVVGAEIQSTGLDKSTRGRDVTCLFGDGAGAIVVSAGEDGKQGVLSTHLHADGKYAEALWIEAPGSQLFPVRISAQMVEEGRHYPKMQGRKVFTMAVQMLPMVVNEALGHNNLSLDDVDLIIPHQANERINQAMMQKLGVSQDKVFSNIEKYGNTTAASIPIALYEAEEEGRIKKGDLVVLAAFGAGFTWASAVVRW
jgi:3-oxoacyl-[acyl-carrier-protein] synthase-3